MNYFYFIFIYNVIFLIPDEVVTSDDSLSDFCIIIFLLSDSVVDFSGSDIELTDVELVDSVFSSIGGSISKILDFEDVSDSVLASGGGVLAPCGVDCCEN